MSPVEEIAVIVSLLGVWLTARRIWWCWPVGLVGVLLYAWLFYGWKLYSDMLLQGAYVVLQLYGWRRWRVRADAETVVGVAPLPTGEARMALGCGVAGAMALGWAMRRFTDAALPWMDAGLTSFSLVATLWAARRHRENWVLWIVVDTIYAGMFAYRGFYLTAALYALFVGLAIYGAVAWRGVGRRARFDRTFARTWKAGA
ncbi:nicotinamide riboside transporter PnuC [Acetobacter sacchari]|nr:nicotinamide riboside transporter PnuC [Acetobacter sacchari]